MTDAWIERVRDWMKTAGMSQEGLAQGLECTRGAVGHYLAGRRQPTLLQLERIAGVMGVHPAWLLYGVGPPDSDQRNLSLEPRVRSQALLPVLEHGKTRWHMDLSPLNNRCYGIRMGYEKPHRHPYEGQTVIVDPAATPSPGDEILAGFADGGYAVYELVAAGENRIILSALGDPTLLRECETSQLHFIHRVIGVMQPQALALLPVEAI